jgi:hypothetical protein
VLLFRKAGEPAAALIEWLTYLKHDSLVMVDEPIITLDEDADPVAIEKTTHAFKKVINDILQDNGKPIL